MTGRPDSQLNSSNSSSSSADAENYFFPHIRLFDGMDLPFAIAQTQREGWDTTPKTMALFIKHTPNGSFIAEYRGTPTGMVTTTIHENTGWIGNLIVAPGFRRRGIGEQLMIQAMRYLVEEGLRTIRLEADPPGMGIYCRLGFQNEYESLRFKKSISQPVRYNSARKLLKEDLPAIIELDKTLFGDNREKMIRMLFEHANNAFWVTEQNEVLGYVFTQPNTSGLRIGPWVAKQKETAEILLQSALSDLIDTTIILGTPAGNNTAVELLDSYGFTSTPSCIRMFFGKPEHKDNPANIYAIANGAVG